MGIRCPNLKYNQISQSKNKSQFSPFQHFRLQRSYVTTALQRGLEVSVAVLGSGFQNLLDLLLGQSLQLPKRIMNNLWGCKHAFKNFCLQKSMGMQTKFYLDTHVVKYFFERTYTEILPHNSEHASQLRAVVHKF